MDPLDTVMKSLIGSIAFIVGLIMLIPLGLSYAGLPTIIEATEFSLGGQIYVITSLCLIVGFGARYLVQVTRAHGPLWGLGVEKTATPTRDEHYQTT